MRFIRCCRCRGGIGGAYDDDLDSVGDQGFDVRLFLGGVALAEEDLDIVSGLGEGIAETGLVLGPALLILGRENDADLQLRSRLFLVSRCEYHGRQEQRYEADKYDH